MTNMAALTSADETRKLVAAATTGAKVADANSKIDAANKNDAGKGLSVEDETKRIKQANADSNKTVETVSAINKSSPKETRKKINEITNNPQELANTASIIAEGRLHNSTEQAIPNADKAKFVEKISADASGEDLAKIRKNLIDKNSVSSKTAVDALDKAVAKNARPGDLAAYVKGVASGSDIANTKTSERATIEAQRVATILSAVKDNPEKFNAAINALDDKQLKAVMERSTTPESYIPWTNGNAGTAAAIIQGATNSNDPSVKARVYAQGVGVPELVSGEEKQKVEAALVGLIKSDSANGIAKSLANKPDTEKEAFYNRSIEALKGGDAKAVLKGLEITGLTRFPSSIVGEIRDYIAGNAVKRGVSSQLPPSVVWGKDCIKLHNGIISEVLFKDPNMKLGSKIIGSGSTHEILKQAGKASELTTFKFLAENGQPARGNASAHTLANSVGEYVKNNYKGNRVQVYGIAIHDGYHSVTLTVGNNAKGELEYHLIDNGGATSRVTGHAAFKTPDELDAALNNYVRKSHQREYRVGRDKNIEMPAKIDVYEIYLSKGK